MTNTRDDRGRSGCAVSIESRVYRRLRTVRRYGMLLAPTAATRLPLRAAFSCAARVLCETQRIPRHSLRDRTPGTAADRCSACRSRPRSRSTCPRSTAGVRCCRRTPAGRCSPALGLVAVAVAALTMRRPRSEVSRDDEPLGRMREDPEPRSPAVHASGTSSPRSSLRRSPPVHRASPGAARGDDRRPRRTTLLGTPPPCPRTGSHLFLALHHVDLSIDVSAPASAARVATDACGVADAARPVPHARARADVSRARARIPPALQRMHAGVGRLSAGSRRSRTRGVSATRQGDHARLGHARVPAAPRAPALRQPRQPAERVHVECLQRPDRVATRGRRRARHDRAGPRRGSESAQRVRIRIGGHRRRARPDRRVQGRRSRHW